MARSIEEFAVEWSRSLGLFKGTPADRLGEGRDVLPIVFASALLWLSIQMLLVPICRLAAPSLVRAVERVAREKAKGDADAAAQDALRDVGVRFVALVFSTLVSYGALRLNWDNPPQFAEDPFFSSSPYAMFYCAVAAGYFVWDLPICLIYGYGPSFLIHATLCLAAELLALHPFNQWVMNFSHLFELSTPFLNIRLLMIASGYTHSVLFSICEAAFVLSFFGARILYGYFKTYEFMSRVASDLLSGKSEIAVRKGMLFVPVAWASIVIALVFCLLNAYWFSRILKMLTGGKRPKKAD